MGNTNQFGTNKCHDIKKNELDIKPFAFFSDFSKSPINKYSDFHNKVVIVKQPQSIRKLSHTQASEHRPNL